MALSIYRPTISHYPIYIPREGSKPCLKYNHDVDIVRFQDKFIASWNANETAEENVPGQYNYLSYSDDFKNWTMPIQFLTSEAYCENPVDSDNQWQPSFINYHDKILFCAWCDVGAQKTYIASSVDGIKWKNQKINTAPDELSGMVIGFPTNHGLLLKNGIMVFPCSLPFIEAQSINENGKRSSHYRVGKTRYAAMIISSDGGQTWSWGKPIEAISWSDIGENPDLPGGNTITLWEPGIFEESSGRLGMLIRNVSNQDAPERDPFMKPHHMILHACSDDSGQLWSKARPVEVDSVISRIYPEAGAGTPDSLMMVMNDWIVNVPERISHDRFFLSLYCSPICDPDLMLPGPTIQPDGGTAFYPNGFIDGSCMYVAYTYPSSIMGTKIEPIPDFNKPFLLPRGSRSGLYFEESIVRLTQKWSSIGLVLNQELTNKAILRLSFDFRVTCRREDHFSLITLGGKTRAGAKIICNYNKDSGNDFLAVEFVSGEKLMISEFDQGCWLTLELTLGSDFFEACLNGIKIKYNYFLLRKICFGGLYEEPEWPLGCSHSESIEIDLNSIYIN
jgi:hypothetical protein